MKKYLISIVAISSTLLIPAIFADTNTGSGTTGTGTTGTGTTGTGTTGTGTTGTGTTGTGTTGTGVNCNTGSVQTNQAALLAAQVAFSTEISRLLTVKQSAYTVALTLTGSSQIDALRSANQAFRTGFKSAIRLLQSVRQSNRSSHDEFKQCKKEDRKEMKVEKKEHRDEMKSDKKEHRDEMKSDIKDLKEQIKDLRDKNKEYQDKR